VPSRSLSLPPSLLTGLAFFPFPLLGTSVHISFTFSSSLFPRSRQTGREGGGREGGREGGKEGRGVGDIMVERCVEHASRHYGMESSRNHV